MSALNRPIEQAAAFVTFFEKARLHDTNAEFRLSDPILLGAGTVPFSADTLTATVRCFHLTDVVLDADQGVITQDGRLIPETSYFVPAGYQPPRIEPRALADQPGDEAYIIGYNKVHADYQHWLTQCLPAIDWALRQQRERPVRLVLPPLTDWQEEFLRIMGHADVPRLVVQPGRFYHLPHAEYAEFLNGSVSFRVCLSVHATMRRLLEQLPPASDSHPILFVPCSNPYYGTLTNEAELIDLFRRSGVYIVSQALAPAARINLFRQAKVVIGPFGQGLSDVLFAAPGTLLWEWMPRHHQNASVNRLAQAARVDYWGDVFESGAGSGIQRPWSVDPDLVRQRLSEISERLARTGAVLQTRQVTPEQPAADIPIDELMLAFESLGDNCEFGLVQRHAGVEPLGLFRFAGMPIQRLLKALATRFEGVGDIDNVIVFPGGPTREFMVHETSLDAHYHTFIHEGEISPDELRQRQAKQLGFLRRKILEDLANGEKIWVWRALDQTVPDPITPLLGLLRSYGPNRLLWVTAADAAHAPGTIECLAPDFIRGYVERLAPYEDAGNFHARSWFGVCQAVHAVWRAGSHEPAPPVQAAPPLELTAMDILRMKPASPSQAASSRPRRRWLSWLH